MTSITIHNLKHHFGERLILDVPAFQVESGEILGIIGPSGAGKSTLLRLLALLETPSAGRVQVKLNGTAAAENITLEQQRRLAIVFQRPLLLSRSVQANIAYGLHIRGQTADQAVQEAMERLGLAHLAKAQPRTLSGGEMQRVAIARALVYQPDLILLDEPTANLDPHNVRLVEDYLMAIYEKSRPTIVIVTHNIYQARRLSQRMALLLEGRIIEQGPPEQFFTVPHDPRTASFIGGDMIY